MKEIGDEDPAAHCDRGYSSAGGIKSHVPVSKDHCGVPSARRARKSGLWRGTASTRRKPPRIIASQLPVKEKTGFADWVIENDGTKEDTLKQVERPF